MEIALSSLGRQHFHPRVGTVAGYFQKAIVVCLVLWIGMGGTLCAFEVADPKVLVPPPVLSGLILQSSDQNMERTLLIRRAFLEDKALGSHHIGIRFKDGLVTLWGPVERRELIELARKKAALQRGVVEVRSELYLGRTGNRFVGTPSSGIPMEQPVRIQAASPNPQTGILPASSFGEEKAKPSGVGSPKETPLLHQPPPALGDQLKGVQVLGGGDFSTKAPQFVPLSFGGTVPTPMPRDPIAPPLTPALDISVELARIRGSQARFAGIQWIRRGNHLSIVVPGADLSLGSDFSQLARQIPGVESVTVHLGRN